MSKKSKKNCWESSCTPTPLFATTEIVGCCFKYNSTPNNVRYVWPNNKSQ